MVYYKGLRYCKICWRWIPEHRREHIIDEHKVNASKHMHLVDYYATKRPDCKEARNEAYLRGVMMGAIKALRGGALCEERLDSRQKESLVVQA